MTTHMIQIDLTPDHLNELLSPFFEGFFAESLWARLKNKKTFEEWTLRISIAIGITYNPMRY
jgi:hypothetical protein